MQGPVYGTRIKEMTDKRLHTRFDFDEVWGTVVNRFCIEAILGIPLTIYGKGDQTRGYLSLEDSVNALNLLIENPPEYGNYRVVNQFVELLSINEIAKIVQKSAKTLGIDVEIKYYENPRVEANKHYYNPEIKILPKLGFKPKFRMSNLVGQMIEDLIPYKNRISKFQDRILPYTNWKKIENKR
jgi:nucleoside-diphosphate-sugar epimerase